MPKSSIRSIVRILLGATTPSQSVPGSDRNEGVNFILKSLTITGVLTLDCFVSYIGQPLGEYYLFVEMQSVYLTTPAN